MFNETSSICFYSSKSAVKLTNLVPSVPQASFSTILSLAAWLLHHEPTLSPPNFSHENKANWVKDESFPSIQLSFSDYFEPWCDFLSSIIEAGDVIKKGKTLYFFVETSEDYVNHLKNEQAFQKIEIDQKLSRNQLAEKVFEVEVKPSSAPTINISIANFSTSQLDKDPYKPKVNLCALLEGAFFEQGDKWSRYNILASHYPTAEQWKSLDVLILTGSSHSINKSVDEVERFLEILKTAIEQNPGLKVLGLCFGHQVVTKMMGGQVITKEFFGGLENITFNTDVLKKLPYFPSPYRQAFLLCQFHFDHADIVPQNYQIMASSPSTINEAMVSSDGRVLCFQFHMEYTILYTRGTEARINHYIPNSFPNVSKEVDEKTRKEHLDSVLSLREVVRNFMNAKITSK